MYGGAGKLRRGGGGSGGGRKSSGKPLSSSFRHQTPPLHRLSSGTRSRAATSAAPAPTSAPSTGAEESFSLVRGNPLSFAMIIRLAPDLVDEIRRAEGHGGAAKIKFDANPNNPSGNVIDVGGKNFRFTWSREVGDLCDIYEERQSGKDVGGLLVESGCAWRKLNVQRVLDESTKNHVKKRSEEAEWQQKSRKAIILDPGNPSMKNQIKAPAAAETTPWRKPFQQKKEPEFKKKKIDTPPVATGGLAKSVYKSGLPSTTTVMGRPSISSSPHQQSGAAASPFITGNMTKGHVSAEDLLSNQAIMKESVSSSEKEKFNKPTSNTMQKKPGCKGNFPTKSVDLQSMLITLLKENPKGMSLKGLEKAVGDSIPNSLKKIEPIIKKIATFQAPGRYILKPGVELGGSKKPLSESGSCPDDNGQQTPVEEKHGGTTTLTPTFAQKNFAMELEKPAMSNPNLGQEMNSFDNVDILCQSPDNFGEKKVSDNSEGPACSSSDSESDSSDSEHDSGSKSRSRSKSMSPVRSRSPGSSDRESDDYSNSKQGSDEDVDIMTSDDDDNSKPKPQVSEPEFSASPIPLRAFEVGPVQNGFEEVQNANGSDLVEIEHNMPDGIHQARIAVVDSDKNVQTEHMLSERENIANDVSKHDRSRNTERMCKSKSKRGSDSKPAHEKSGHAKRLKSGNLPQPQLSWPRDTLLSESPQTMPSDRIIEEAYKGRSSEIINRALKDGSASSVVRKGNSQGFGGTSSMDYQKSGRRPSDHNGFARASEATERPGTAPESLDCGTSSCGKNKQFQEHLSLQKDGDNSDFQVDNHHNKQKLKNSKENSFGEKTPVVVLGRGKMLQRELSDLELGEFRNPLPEETAGAKGLENKGSFEETENIPSSSDYWNTDLSKGRPAVRAGVPSNMGGPPTRNPEYQTEDLARPPNRVLQSQPKSSLHTSRADRAEVGIRKLGKVIGKKNRENRENSVDGLGDAHMNVSLSGSKQHDVERGQVFHPKGESKTRKSNSFPDPGEVKKDGPLTSSERVIRRGESSSDENSFSFSKYEKEEPELKGPIKEFSHYKEYVQEYQEKYDSYCWLNKTLENYRNEFYNLGKDLENAKGRDVEKYYQILEQLLESYRQCGNKHKRMKKIFIVLHEELKHLKQEIQNFAASYART